MDTREKLDNTIKVVSEVLEKYKADPSIKEECEAIQILKENRKGKNI